MTSLPTVGGDSGNLGTILNAYLQTEHSATGTHGLSSGLVTDVINTVAASGATIGTMNVDFSTKVAPFLNPRFSKFVVVCACGANDLGISSLSAADIWDGIVTYINSVKAILPSAKVVVQTVTPSEVDSAYEARRITYNAYVKSHWVGVADALMDVGSDATIGVPGAQLNTTYYVSDKTHFTDAGQNIWAGIVTSAIQGLS